MKVWLLKTGEPLPLKGSSNRLLRMGMLAKELTSRGHDVHWFASTTNHFTRKKDYEGDTHIKVNNHLTFTLFDAPVYKRSVSLTRLYNHYVIGKKFQALAPTLEKPDVIVACMPTLEFASAAVAYGKKYNVPVVVDIRDLWPDIFLEIAPSFLRPLAKLLLWPMYKHLKKAMTATSVVSLTKPMLEWGRKPLSQDKVFPLGYATNSSEEKSVAAAEAFWDGLGVKDDGKTRYIVYIGNLNKRCDLELVVQTVRFFKSRLDFKFIICGDGEDCARLKNLASDLQNIVFTGWVDKSQIDVLLKRSHVGLMPYPTTFDFAKHLVNKVFEYWSAGLPIASVLNGHLEEVMDEHQVGLTAKTRTPEAFAETITALLDDRPHYQKMRQNALSFFENFRAEKVYKDYTDHLENLAKGKTF